jgi:hypothetical protein
MVDRDLGLKVAESEIAAKQTLHGSRNTLRQSSVYSVIVDDGLCVDERRTNEGARKQ